MDAKKPRLEADAGSVKWITPWGGCTVYLDNDGDLTIDTADDDCDTLLGTRELSR